MQKKTKAIIGITTGVVAVGATAGGLGAYIGTSKNIASDSDLYLVNTAPELVPVVSEKFLQSITARDLTLSDLQGKILDQENISFETRDLSVKYQIISFEQIANTNGQRISVTIRVSKGNQSKTYTKEINGFLTLVQGTEKFLNSINEDNIKDHIKLSLQEAAKDKNASQILATDIVVASDLVLRDYEIKVSSVNVASLTSVNVNLLISRNGIQKEVKQTIIGIIPAYQSKVDQANDVRPLIKDNLVISYNNGIDSPRDLINKVASQISLNDFHPIVPSDNDVDYKVVSIKASEQNAQSVILTIRKTSKTHGNNAPYSKDYSVEYDNLLSSDMFELYNNRVEANFSVNFQTQAKRSAYEYTINDLKTIGRFSIDDLQDPSKTISSLQQRGFKYDLVDWAGTDFSTGLATIEISYGQEKWRYSKSVSGFLSQNELQKRIFDELVSKFSANEITASRISSNNGRLVTQFVTSDFKIDTPEGDIYKRAGVNSQILSITNADDEKGSLTLKVRLIVGSNQKEFDINVTNLPTREVVHRFLIDNLVNELKNNEQRPSLVNRETLDSKKASEVQVSDFNPIRNSIEQDGRASAVLKSIENTNDQEGRLTLVYEISVKGVTNINSGIYKVDFGGFNSERKTKENLIRKYIEKQLVPFFDEKENKINFLPSQATSDNWSKFKFPALDDEDKNKNLKLSIVNTTEANDETGTLSLQVKVEIEGFSDPRVKDTYIVNVSGFSSNAYVKSQRDVEAYSREIAAENLIQLRKDSLIDKQTTQSNDSSLINKLEVLPFSKGGVEAKITNTRRKGDGKSEETILVVTLELKSQILATEEFYSKSFDFEVPGWASSELINNKNDLEGYVQNTLVSKRPIIPFVKDFDKSTTLVDAVKLEDFVKDYSVVHNGKGIKFEVISWSSNPLSEEQIRNFEQSNTEITHSGTATVRISIGENTNKWSDTYTFVVEGFPSSRKADNQKIVNDYVDLPETDTTKAKPLLARNVNKNTLAPRSLLTSHFEINTHRNRSRRVNVIIKSVEVDKNDQTKAIVTLEASAGSGNERATKEYAYRFEGFLNNLQEDIYNDIEAIARRINAAQRANNIELISSSFRLADPRSKKLASEALASDLFFANSNSGTIFSANIDSSGAQDISGKVRFTIRGTRDGESINSSTLVEATIFSPNAQLIINKAPELAPIFAGQVQEKTNANAQTSDLRVIAPQNQEYELEYKIVSLRAHNSTNRAIDGSEVSVQISVNIKGQSGFTPKVYTRIFSGYLSNDKFANKQKVDDYISRGSRANLVIDNAIKGQKSVIELEPSDFSFDFQAAGLNLEIGTITTKGTLNTTAVVEVLVSAGNTTNSRYTKSYNVEIAGFKEPGAAENRIKLKKYINDLANRKNPVLLQSVDKENTNASDLKASDFEIVKNAGFSGDIIQTIESIARKDRNPEVALVTIKVVTGEGDKVAEDKYTYEIPGFASNERIRHLGLISAYTSSMSEALYQRAKLTQNRKPNQVSLLAITQDQLSVNSNFTIDQLSNHSQLHFSVLSVVPKINEETTAIITIRIQAPTSNAGVADKDIATFTYSYEESGYLTNGQVPNFLKAQDYAKKAENQRSKPILNTGLDKNKTPVRRLTINSFTITQPTEEGLKLEITKVEPDPTNNNNAKVTITVVAGSGINENRSVTYEHIERGFASEGKAVNEANVKEYIESSDKALPSLVVGIEKERVEAQSISSSNLFIQQPDPTKGLSLTIEKVNVQDQSLIVEIRVSAGSGQNLASQTYNHTITGFATQEQTKNYALLRKYVTLPGRRTPSLVEPQSRSVKTVSQLQTNDWKIDQPGSGEYSSIQLSIKEIKELERDKSWAVVIVEATIGSLKDTYQYLSSGFATQAKKVNIDLVQKWVKEQAQTNKPTLKNEVETQKANIAVINLNVDNDFIIPTNLPENLSIDLLSVSEKSDSETDQKIARLRVKVSAGRGSDYYEEFYYVDYEGFAERRVGQSIRAITNYIANVENRAQVFLKVTSSINKHPSEITKEDLDIPNSGVENIKVEITEVKKIENDATTLDLNRVTAIVRVSSTDQSLTSHTATYESNIFGFTTRASYLIQQLINSNARPSVLQTKDGSQQVVSQEERKKILPSEINVESDLSFNNVTINNLTNDDLKHFNFRFTNVNPNNDRGTLSLSVIATVGATTRSFNISLEGFATASSHAVEKAPQLQYIYSNANLSQEEQSASKVNAVDFRLTSDSQANLPQNLTYTITNVVSSTYNVTQGSTTQSRTKATLTITISSLDQTSSRTYTQEIEGFVSDNRAENIVAVKGYLSEIQASGRAPKSGTTVIQIPTLDPSVIQNNSTDEFVNKILTNEHASLGININKNPQSNNSNLEQSILSAEVLTTNEYPAESVKLIIQVKSKKGDDQDHYSREYWVVYSGFIQRTGADILNIRRAIEASLRENDKAQHIVKVKESSREKITKVESTTTVGKNFFTTSDFEINNELIKTKVTNVQNIDNYNVKILSVLDISRENIISGNARVKIRISKKDNSSEKSEFIVNISGFETLSEAFDEYIKSSTRFIPSVKEANKDLWDTKATSEENFFSTPSQNKIDNKFDLAVKERFVFSVDTSKVKFKMELSKTIKTNFGIESTFFQSAQYEEDVDGFKKELFDTNDIFRVQYEKDGKTINKYVKENEKNSHNIDFTKIKKLEIGPNFSEIPKDYFKDASSLTELKINSGVSKIKESAFESAKLTSLELPNSLVEIGPNAFKNSVLTSLSGLEQTKLSALKENVFEKANDSIKTTIWNWKKELALKEEPILTSTNKIPSSEDKKAKKPSQFEQSNFSFAPTKQEDSDIHFEITGFSQDDVFGTIEITYKIKIKKTDESFHVFDENNPSKKVLTDFKTNLEEKVIQIKNASSYFDSSKIETIEKRKDTSSNNTSTENQNKYRLVQWKDVNKGSQSVFLPQSSVNAPFVETTQIGDKTTSVLDFNNPQGSQIRNNSLFENLKPKSSAYLVWSNDASLKNQSKITLLSTFKNNSTHSLHFESKVLSGWIPGSGSLRFDQNNSNIDRESQDVNKANIESTENNITAKGSMPQSFIFGQESKTILEIYRDEQGRYEFTFFVFNNNDKVKRYKVRMKTEALAKAYLIDLSSIGDTGNAKFQAKLKSVISFNQENNFLTYEERIKLLDELGKKWFNNISIKDDSSGKVENMTEYDNWKTAENKQNTTTTTTTS